MAEPQRLWRRAPLRAAIALGAVASLAIGAFVLRPPAAEAADPIHAGKTVRIAVPQNATLAAMSTGESATMLAEGDDARTRNAKIAFAGVPVEPMRGFAMRAIPANAERCLTEAIYYEAGFEPEQGRRGVAQVVLNRVRHPAYPNSVCGVVYQGVNAPVCQFSFTCDGSLDRRPATGAWAAARRIAREALAGKVEASVGTATHYHADYVVPRWAYTLGKVTQLGSHIFYRFNGRVGGARAFTALYSGSEVIPARRAALVEALPGGPDPMTGRFENGLTVAPDITDRHAPSDIGGRIDTTKGWRLTLPKRGNGAGIAEIGADQPAGQPGVPTAQATAKVAQAAPQKGTGAP